MSFAVIALNQILIMFIIIIIGVICFKVKLIDKDTNRRLSDIVLMLVNPVVIFISYQREFNATLLKGLLISLVFATITHAFGIALSYLLLRKKKHVDDIGIERYAIVYSNCGFMGIPLVNGIFGSEGVFYLTAYMTIFNLLVWTHGVIIMTGKKDKKTITNALLSPSIIATVLGFLLFVLRIEFPNILLKSLDYVGGMNTPLAMIAAGVTIAQTNLIKALRNLRIYYICFLKLLVIPIAMLLLFSCFEIDETIIITSVLLAACPTGAIGTLFAIKFGKNALYASEIFAVTTILSMITIPLIMALAGYLV